MMYFHHRGAPRRWVIIPPVEKIKFENKMRLVVGGEYGDSRCSQFIRHMRVWIQTEVLKSWGIQFFEVTQHAQELVFFFPGTYFYGFSEGLSIMESKLHAGIRLDRDAYKYCDASSGFCKSDNLLPNLDSTIPSTVLSEKPASKDRGRTRNARSEGPSPDPEERRPEKRVQRAGQPESNDHAESINGKSDQQVTE
jgi:hypothetical protein